MEVHFYLSSGKICHESMEVTSSRVGTLSSVPWHYTPPSLLALLSAVKRHPPTFSLLVLRNVSKFAGPCETSPGCFGSSSSDSCTVPVIQVSCMCFGFFLDWWGGLRMELHLRLTLKSRKNLVYSYLSAWDFSGPWLSWTRAGRLTVYLDAIFHSIEGNCCRMHPKTFFPHSYF